MALIPLFPSVHPDSDVAFATTKVYCFIKNKFHKENKIMTCMKKIIGAY